jgi:hypothetical protein
MQGGTGKGARTGWGQHTTSLIPCFVTHCWTFHSCRKAVTGELASATIPIPASCSTKPADVVHLFQSL